MPAAEVMIGLDPHKASNTIAVLDRTETILNRGRFDHDEHGLETMLKAVAAWPQRIWAVEGGHGMGRNIAQLLVAAGETVIDVPAKLASRVRVYSTGHGNKTDDTHAVAFARAALHSRNLRRVVTDDSTVRLKLLSDRRRELVAARTQSACRLHRLFLELIPGGARTELTAKHPTGLLDGLDFTGPASRTRLELAREHITDIERLDSMIKTAGNRIAEAVQESKTSVIDVYGVGPLNAALNLDEVGDIARFATRDQFASFAGTAPLSVSSGDHNRHRLSRAGNRQLNSAHPRRRDHTSQKRHTRPRLLPAQARRRQEPTRSASMPEATNHGCDLASTPRRPRNDRQADQPAHERQAISRAAFYR